MVQPDLKNRMCCAFSDVVVVVAIETSSWRKVDDVLTLWTLLVKTPSRRRHTPPTAADDSQSRALATPTGPWRHVPRTAYRHCQRPAHLFVVMVTGATRCRTAVPGNAICQRGVRYGTVSVCHKSRFSIEAAKVIELAFRQRLYSTYPVFRRGLSDIRVCRNIRILILPSKLHPELFTYHPPYVTRGMHPLQLWRTYMGHKCIWNPPFVTGIFSLAWCISLEALKQCFIETSLGSRPYCKCCQHTAMWLWVLIDDSTYSSTDVRCRFVYHTERPVYSASTLGHMTLHMRLNMCPSAKALSVCNTTGRDAERRADPSAPADRLLVKLWMYIVSMLNVVHWPVV